MANNCGIITEGIAADCSTQIVAGAKATLRLANFSEMQESFFEYDEDDEDVIKSITLSSSPAIKFYEFVGLKQSVAPQIASVDNPYFALMNHQIDFIVFANTRAAKKQVQALNQGTFVAIVQNNDTGDNGDAAFEYFGKKTGIECNGYKNLERCRYTGSLPDYSAKSSGSKGAKTPGDYLRY